MGYNGTFVATEPMRLAVLPVGEVINNLVQAGLYFRLIAVPDRFDQQVAKPLFTEKLTQDVEYAATKGFAFQLYLFE